MSSEFEHTNDSKQDEEGSKHLGFHFEMNDDGAPEITEVGRGCCRKKSLVDYDERPSLQVVEGSPAAGGPDADEVDDEERLQSLDILYEVNGKQVHDQRVGTVNKLLAADEKVTISIIREKAGNDEDEVPEEFKALMEAAGIAEGACLPFSTSANHLHIAFQQGRRGGKRAMG